MISFFRTTTNNGIEHARVYLHGLLKPGSSRRNLSGIEDAVHGADYEGLQHFIANSPWQAAPLMNHVAAEVSRLLDGPQCMVYVDECFTSKKGTKSVGVAKMHNERLGKMDNCQATVFLAIGRGRRVALAGARLYLPREWREDPARCMSAGIPENFRIYKSKAALVLELVQHLRGLGTRFAATWLHDRHGNDPSLLRALDSAGEVFVADVPGDLRVALEKPVPEVKSPMTLSSASAWADSHSADAWVPLVLREGSKVEVALEFVHQCVWWHEDGTGAAKCWHLVAWRLLDAYGRRGKISWTMSNAGVETPPARIVAMACSRLCIDRSFHELKASLDMADYQIRGWLAWHHHTALLMLALLFQLQERMVHAQEPPPLSDAEIADLLLHHLPAAGVSRVRDTAAARQRSQPPGLKGNGDYHPTALMDLSE